MKSVNFRESALTIAIAAATAALGTASAFAADVIVTPSAGSSFVVKNSAGSADRLRVNESGAVALPAVPGAAAQSIALCADVVGVLGPCAANAGFSLPYSATVNNAATLFDVTQSGTGGALKGMISNAANTGAAVRGETNGTGYGVFGQATGSGSAAFFQISNPPSTSSAMNVTTNAIGSGVTVQLTNASNGARGVDVNQSGVGPGVFAVSAGGNAVWGITSAMSAAGVNANMPEFHTCVPAAPRTSNATTKLNTDKTSERRSLEARIANSTDTVPATVANAPPSSSCHSP